MARRALVLAAVTCRGSIESDPASETLRQSIAGWLQGLGLAKEAEPTELALLATPVGQLPRQQQIDATWRSEGLGTLAWALRRAELVRYDHQCEPEDIAERVGFMTDSPTVLDRPALRSPEELSWLADLMFSLHWRLRQFSLTSELDFAHFAETAWFGPLQVEGLVFAKGDLAIEGVPVGESSRWREVLSIARERQQAANWLLGQDPIYSEVTTDT